MNNFKFNHLSIVTLETPVNAWMFCDWTKDYGFIIGRIKGIRNVKFRMLS
jgi:hypothetical protein